MSVSSWVPPVRKMRDLVRENDDLRARIHTLSQQVERLKRLAEAAAALHDLFPEEDYNLPDAELELRNALSNTPGEEE